MIGAVPEREQEIRDLWGKYDPEVELISDSKGITIQVLKGGKIAFNIKSIDVFWLIGFSGWLAIECYSPLVVCSEDLKQPIDTLLAADTGLSEVERAYKEHRAAAQTFIDATSIDWEVWPPEIMKPNAARHAQSDPNYQAAFDLTSLAVAFIFFHEFKHVMLERDGECPSDRREEELACDVWAREFMTAKLAAYADSHRHKYTEVLQKRSMAFALASLIIHEITPFWEHGGNKQYFSVKDRMQAILDNTKLPDSSHFWNFTASLLVGIYRQAARPIEEPGMKSKDLALRLVQTL